MLLKMDVWIDTDDRAWLNRFMEVDGPVRWRMIYSGELNGRIKSMSFSEPVITEDKGGTPSTEAKPV